MMAQNNQTIHNPRLTVVVVGSVNSVSIAYSVDSLVEANHVSSPVSPVTSASEDWIASSELSDSAEISKFW